MAFNYIVTAHPPSVVTHAVTGYFTSADERNLIIAKSTRLEIHILGLDGVRPLLDIGMYGRVCILQLFRPPTEEKDLLFICTDNYMFCVLAYDQESKEIVTRANGDLQDRSAVPADLGPIGIIDPECRMIGLRLFNGLFKVIPIDPRGQLKEAFNIRLEELQVFDIKFLHGHAKPTLLVLYQDQKETRHVKSYEVLLKEKEFAEGPWQLNNVENGASTIIPVLKPLGGALIIGEHDITYFHGNFNRSISMRPAIITSYAVIDMNRFLLADSEGNLHSLLLVVDASNKVANIKLDRLGVTSILSSICYLDNGVIFGGSKFGDSQLIRLTTERDERGSYLRILESFNNLGPIVDFCVVDLDRQGQGQLITCSGGFKDGSLRIVRNGVGLEEQATIELPGVKGIWSLKPNDTSSFRSILAVSFIGETRFLAMSGGEALDETQIEGFSNSAQTLLCSNVTGNHLLQVTAVEVRLINCSTLQCVASWSPSASPGVYGADARITVASSNDYQVLVASGGGHLTCLSVEASGNLVPIGHTVLEHEIACVDITPISGQPIAQLCAVGLWTDITVRLLSIPSFDRILVQPLGGEIIPRSILISTFESIPYVLCALGDGSMHSFVLDPLNNRLTDHKRISLGTQPIVLSSFQNQGRSYVFACSDRPTVIHSSNRKLLYSNVNLPEVTHMCPFSSESFADCLAVISSNALSIGTIDNIQKLHIRTIPLNEMPRRIAYNPSLKTFVVGTLTMATPVNNSGGTSSGSSSGSGSGGSALGVDRMVIDNPRAGGQNGGVLEETHFVRLYSSETFELLDSFQLSSTENVMSIITCQFTDDPTLYYVVGTAFVKASEDEPTAGRILVFSVSVDGKLVFALEKSVRGSVYALNAFNGKLLACINSKVVLFKWELSDDSRRELLVECSHSGLIIALYLQSRGDFILVGDLMRSVHLLVYKSVSSSIEEIAFDMNSKWMTAVDMFDDDVYLGAENSFNVFVCTKNSEAATEEERRRLDVVGEFHVGEFINCFRKGSLVMQLPSEDEQIIQSSVLYATTNGVIGVIGRISQQNFEFLNLVQTKLATIVKGVGGLSHKQWRSFRSEGGVGDMRGFIDGDLVELFLDLPRAKMEEVVQGLTRNGQPVTVDDLVKIVEDLTRIH